VRNINIMPMAIPKDQNMPIRESSRISAFFARNSIPRAESTENTVADKIGFKPKKVTQPYSPKEAWVIPHL
jgi:hypothetical protein